MCKRSRRVASKLLFTLIPRGNATILNASPPNGSTRFFDVSRPIAFSLSSVLGESLRTHGSVTYTLNLKAGKSSSGIVSAWLSELKLTGEKVVVGGANVSSIVF
jgi:hypothetical protein